MGFLYHINDSRPLGVVSLQPFIKFAKHVQEAASLNLSLPAMRMMILFWLIWCKSSLLFLISHSFFSFRNFDVSSSFLFFVCFFLLSCTFLLACSVAWSPTKTQLACRFFAGLCSAVSEPVFKLCPAETPVGSSFQRGWHSVVSQACGWLSREAEETKAQCGMDPD